MSIRSFLFGEKEPEPDVQRNSLRCKYCGAILTPMAKYTRVKCVVCGGLN